SRREGLPGERGGKRQIGIAGRGAGTDQRGLGWVLLKGQEYLVDERPALLLVEFHLDTHLAEHLLQYLACHAVLVTGEGEHGELEAVGIAGLGQQLLRTLGVVTVGRLLDVAERRGRDRGGHDRRE